MTGSRGRARTRGLLTPVACREMNLSDMSSAPTASSSADRIFLRSLVVTTIIRAVLAAIVPLTGDEAYFVVWGEYLDYGYYDHTPMAGWWLAAALALGKSVWLMRLPALLTTVAVAWMIWRAARTLDPAKAGWVAAIYLWSPHNVLNFFTTTDTPLILFSALCCVLLFRAVRTDRALEYLLAGLMLGLAFLSKYFAVLLGVAVAVLLVGYCGRRRWLGLALVIAGVLPCAAVNIAWNYHHGWTNILFNLFNRTSDAGFSIGNVVAYLAVLVMPVAPLAWFLMRPRVEGRLPWREAWERWKGNGAIVYVITALFPLVLLLLVSTQKPVGAHWPLSYFPSLFIALVVLFSDQALQRLTRAMRIFGVTLCGIAGVGVLLPVGWLSGHKSYDSIVLGTHADEVGRALAPYQGEYELMTFSYAKSAMLSFWSESHVPVIGNGSHHGRQDDLITDFRAFDGKKIVVLCDSEARARLAGTWFEESAVQDIEVRGAHFRLVLGRGFKFAEYREAVLRPIALRYYRMPSWLASWSPASFFFERYGFAPEDAVRD